MTSPQPSATREVHAGHRSGPPYALHGDMTCEVCGHTAVAFWPGHHVDHGDGTACLIDTGKRVRLRPAAQERTVA